MLEGIVCSQVGHLRVPTRILRPFRSTARQAILALMALSVIPLCSFAQSLGTIVGTVTDNSGAAVPNAAILLTYEGTAATRNVVTDAQGTYTIPSVPPGTY